jgi:hypothetical protein
MKKGHVVTSRPEKEKLERDMEYPKINDGAEANVRSFLDEKEEYISELRKTINTVINKDILRPSSELPDQRVEYETLKRDIFTEATNKANTEKFVNSAVSSLTDFMSKDFLFAKNKLHCEVINELMYKRINRFSHDDMLSVLVGSLKENYASKVKALRTWKRNIETYLGQNLLLDQDKIPEHILQSETLRLSDHHRKCDSFRGKRTELEEEIIKLEEELYCLSNIRNTRNMSSEFEKPFIDVSAKIRMYSESDTDKLIKLLFATEDTKDYTLLIDSTHLNSLIIDQILDQNRDQEIRLLGELVKTVVSTVYTKYLRQGPERMFTRFDKESSKLRAKSPKDSFFSLAETGCSFEVSETLTIVNFYEYLLKSTNQEEEYYKFVFKESKMGNLLISKDTLDVLLLTLRKDEQGISRMLRGVLGQRSQAGYFHEAKNVPRFIIDIIEDSFMHFRPSMFEGVCRYSVDSNHPKAKKAGTIKGLKNVISDQHQWTIWQRVTSQTDWLDNLNYKVHEIFPEIIERQLEYLEWEPYSLDSETIILNLLNKSFQSSKKDHYQNIGLMEAEKCKGRRSKIKHAFWVKEGMVYGTPSLLPHEHETRAILEGQIVHPQIDTWLQLCLNNNIQAISYDLEKLLEDLLETCEIKTEDLQTEKRLLKMSLGSSVKMLLLRTRNACLKLMSYLNFNRSTQKSLNLRFLQLCEDGRLSTEQLESERLRTHNKEDVFQQTKVFENNEYGELKRIFDEEQNVQ